MPAIHYYTVRQTREVKVSATEPGYALSLAERVFSGTKKPDDQLNIRSNPVVVEVSVRED